MATTAAALPTSPSSSSSSPSNRPQREKERNDPEQQRQQKQKRQQEEDGSSPHQMPTAAPHRCTDATAAPSDPLFGTIPTDLADALYQSLTGGIVKGVTATLPLVAAVDQGPEQLTQLLQRHYWQVADLVELYGRRNVFALRMYRPDAKRAAIAALYRQNDTADPPPPASSEPETDAAAATEPAAADVSTPSLSSSSSHPPLTSAAQIPTAAAVRSLERETRALRARLHQRQQHRRDVAAAVHEGRAAVELVDLAGLDGDGDNNTSALPATTTAAVQTAVHTVGALRRVRGAGDALRDRMDALKRRRDPAADVIQNVATSSTALPPKPLTLPERYRRDRARLTSTARALPRLEAVTALLRER